MPRRNRRVPRYARVATEAAKAAEDAQARRIAAERSRVAALCAAQQREHRAVRQKYWDSVDPAMRLRRVKPFYLSPHHGITEEVLGRLEQIKQATLGYLESTMLTHDEDRCHLSPGDLGFVASQEQAEHLLQALAAEFPHIPFQIELEEVLLEDIVWRNVDDVLRDATQAEPGAAVDAGSV